MMKKVPFGIGVFFIILENKLLKIIDKEALKKIIAAWWILKNNFLASSDIHIPYMKSSWVHVITGFQLLVFHL